MGGNVMDGIWLGWGLSGSLGAIVWILRGGSAGQIPPLRKQGRSTMRKFAIVALVAYASLSSALVDQGDATRGQQDFRAFAPCHSLEPDRNMTGPSPAGLWGRKAGGLSSFDRYSDALMSSGIIWDDRALDGWLTDAQRMVPDNEMPFEGIKDVRVPPTERPAPFGSSICAS